VIGVLLQRVYKIRDMAVRVPRAEQAREPKSPRVHSCFQLEGFD